MTCECGHPMPDHGFDGCLYPDPFGGLNFCPCDKAGTSNPNETRIAMLNDLHDKVRDTVRDPAFRKTA